MATAREQFGEWLKRAHVTQTEVARRIGRHKSFITNLRKGKRVPSLALAVDLENITGIPAGAWVAQNDAPRARSTSRKAKRARVA